MAPVILAYKIIYNFASNVMLTYFTLQKKFQNSRNGIFSHDTAVFVNILFNKDYHILHLLIKNLCLLKEYTVQKLLRKSLK